uniref:Transposase (Putative), gypsy type n=1 Tax=Tanacetum cinerariifolium TaxID=118510 RepID=A0A6L2N987_TANCI|nr:hypothetical protein [Tanacetum cinerariifolium]
MYTWSNKEASKMSKIDRWIRVIIGLGPRVRSSIKPSNEMISCTIKVSRSEALVWKGSALNHVFADVDSLPRTFLCPQKLSVIAAAKVSHFEILCCVHGFEPTVGLFYCFYVNSKKKGWMSFSKRQGTDAVCYTKPLNSLKGWNDYFFWIDAFACHALFPWHTGKSVSRDVIPKSFEFSPEHYATLVVYPAPFHKYPKPFICLVGMSHNYTLDKNTYPQFLRNDDLLSFIRTADPTKVRIGERQRDEDEPKLLVTIIGRVVPLLLAEQGDFANGGHGVGIDVVAETIVGDKLRDDYRALGGPTVGDSSDHSGVNITEAEVDSVVRTSMPIITSATTTTLIADPTATAKEKLVGSSVFDTDSFSAGRSHPISDGFFDCSGNDFLLGGIRAVIDPDSYLQKFYVPQRNVTNGSCLDDGGVCREMVDEFAPPKIFTSIRGMNHDQLFTEFNVGAASQISLSEEVRMRAEYHIK